MNDQTDDDMKDWKDPNADLPVPFVTDDLQATEPAHRLSVEIQEGYSPDGATNLDDDPLFLDPVGKNLEAINYDPEGGAFVPDEISEVIVRAVKESELDPTPRSRDYRMTVVALLQLEDLERPMKAIKDEMDALRKQAQDAHANARKLLELGKEEKIDQIIPTPLLLAVADINRTYAKDAIEADVAYQQRLTEIETAEKEKAADLAARIEAKREEVKKLGLKAGETVSTQKKQAVWNKPKETVDVKQFKGYCKSLPPAQSEQVMTMLQVGEASVSIRDK